jgi:hypothetical protein
MGVETTSVSSTGAKKGVKKQRFDLIPPRSTMELAKLYGRGAAKYAPNNFRLGYETSKSFAAGQRHAILFWSGENIDTEMNCHHLSSFVWHCFTILESSITHPEFDDRPYQIRVIAPADQHAEEVILSIVPAPQVIGTQYRHDLIPLYPFATVAEVFGTFPELASFGEDITYGGLYAQMQQHANLYWSGQNFDGATGLPNLAFAAAYGLLLLELSLSSPERDDRFLPGAALPYDSVPVPAAGSPVEPSLDGITDGVAAINRLLELAPVIPVGPARKRSGRGPVATKSSGVTAAA